MSFADQLVHRADVMRRQSELDRFGQPRERWSAVETDVHCRVSRMRGGETSTERMRETYDVTHRVFLAVGSSVAEDDQLVVRNQAGDEILSDARIVRRHVVYAGVEGPHHLELEVSSLRGPQ